MVKGDKQWVLKGIHLGSMELVHEGVMDKTMCQMAKGWIMYACSKVEEGSSIGTEVMSSEMRALCTEFSKIFEKPKGLPPRRSYDHQILLVKDAEPVNLRPYRHPWEQKNAIEKMIEEMLESGIIRDSRSPYVSPVLMVRIGRWYIALVCKL